MALASDSFVPTLCRSYEAFVHTSDGLVMASASKLGTASASVVLLGVWGASAAPALELVTALASMLLWSGWHHVSVHRLSWCMLRSSIFDLWKQPHAEPIKFITRNLGCTLRGQAF
eukprot:6378323-Amphidinium_carterae.1